MLEFRWGDWFVPKIFLKYHWNCHTNGKDERRVFSRRTRWNFSLKLWPSWFHWKEGMRSCCNYWVTSWNGEPDEDEAERQKAPALLMTKEFLFNQKYYKVAKYGNVLLSAERRQNKKNLYFLQNELCRGRQSVDSSVLSSLSGDHSVSKKIISSTPHPPLCLF